MHLAEKSHCVISQQPDVSPKVRAAFSEGVSDAVFTAEAGQSQTERTLSICYIWRVLLINPSWLELKARGEDWQLVESALSLHNTQGLHPNAT